MNNYINTNLLDIDSLFGSVKISTMSASCKLGINIDLPNMFKYLPLTEGNIVTIKYKGEIKSLEKIKKKRKKKKNNSFQNQLTVNIRPDINKFPKDKISIKIFKNGSMQMSGVKSLQACNYALNKLIDSISNEYGVIDESGDGIKDISFIENSEDELSIKLFKIDMINSNFNIGYNINREKLYNILINTNIQCRYEPCIHACVNIKFMPESAQKNVSIFVFQSGNIIITGAKNIESIIESYNYINKLLKKYKYNIEKNEIPQNIDGIDDNDNLLDSIVSDNLNYNIDNLSSMLSTI